MTAKTRLRSLPSVNEVLRNDALADLIGRHGRPVVKRAVQEGIRLSRERLLAGKSESSPNAVVSGVARYVARVCDPQLKPVINATGVILHTNLGRAPLGDEVIAEVARIARGYCNIEFDASAAGRGSRTELVRDILKFLTGAEDVLVVNNNAAGVLLALHALAFNREVVVSRGELIEIGGSFRIPEIMAASGARMVEVGATNRTRESDYEKAIGPGTALLLKAHRSNFSMRGFVEEVSVRRLAELARARGLPLLYDIGSGLLRKPAWLGAEREPDVRTAVLDGADIVAFSCDKLLGGPQAGVLAGRADLISRMGKAPMMRALRVCKLTLAALSAACRQHVGDDDQPPRNPTCLLLARTPEAVRSVAVKVLEGLSALGIRAEIVESCGQCGGGTLPDFRIKSFAVKVLPVEGIGDRRHTFAEKLFGRLLESDPQILGILRKGEILFDVLTLFEDDIPALIQATARAVNDLCKSP